MIYLNAIQNWTILKVSKNNDIQGFAVKLTVSSFYLKQVSYPAMINNNVSRNYSLMIHVKIKGKPHKQVKKVSYGI